MSADINEAALAAAVLTLAQRLKARILWGAKNARLKACSTPWFPSFLGRTLLDLPQHLPEHAEPQLCVLG